MKKILIIQSRQKKKDIESEQKQYLKVTKGLAYISFTSAVDANASWNEPKKLLASCDAVFIGGSGDFDFDGGSKSNDRARNGAVFIRERLRPLISYLISHNIPTLGICFGHQIIAEMYGGGVKHNTDQAKKGLRKVIVTKEGQKDRLLSRLSPHFSARYWHKDSVSALPVGATLLATARDCKFSALRYGKNMYTFQFHPERAARTLIEKLKILKKPWMKEEKSASLLLSFFINHIIKRH